MNLKRLGISIFMKNVVAEGKDLSTPKLKN